jgi:hypothetical protein
MAIELKYNVSSDTVAAFNALEPKTAAKKIIAYVESYEDISFWRNILHAYETKRLEFEIKTPTHKGKKGALERSIDLLTMNVGEFLIICVDSDYDFLLPEHTKQSKLINENPYIFQTYSYATENLQCFSESLHPVCVQATKHDRKIIDFNAFLKLYSQIVYKLFLCILYFINNNDHTTFTISDFCSLIKLTDAINITDQCTTAIEGLKARVAAKISALETAHPLAKKKANELALILNRLGLNEENTYLFMHGHTLKDNVVLMLLKPVYQLLVSEKMEHIKINAQHPPQVENDINHYKNQRQDITQVLDSNTEFRNCFLFQKIKADLDRYVTSLS